ncbi:MAG: HAMP domain-containing histidine kinase [Chloroflexi bacterium]|nr:HAMP domain-containing histidine kinase [Chloroflexota bacterium]
MNSLLARFTLAFGLTAILIVAATNLAIDRTVNNSFRSYVQQTRVIENNSQLLTRLEAHYAANGAWDGVQALIDERRPANGSSQNSDRGASLYVTDTDYIIQGATDAAQVGGALDHALRDSAIPLESEGETIGYFARQTQGAQLLAQAEQDFYDEIGTWLTIISIVTAITSLVAGVGFAWWVSRPLRQLVAATRAVREGNLGKQVAVSGARELQQVAAAFNLMSQSLAESEASKRRMTSDIAHELRTPLSVMRGQLEGMMDGILPTNTNQVGIVYNQTLHLSRLVFDLWTLTRAQTSSLSLEKSSTDLVAVVKEVVDAFLVVAEDNGSHLLFEAEAANLYAEVDAGRIRQVLANLVSNALRHTPSGKTVAITLQRNLQDAIIRVEDGGEGLPPEALPHIFDRFFRTDSARQRDTGGAGLGLSIAHELVKLHGGDITVESTVGQGTCFKIFLPLQQKTDAPRENP